MDSVSDSKASAPKRSKPSKDTSRRPPEPGGPELPKGWISEWETFRSSDDAVQLFGELWRTEPWAGPRVLVILHGMGEHCGRYRGFPARLASVSTASSEGGASGDASASGAASTSGIVDAVYGFDHRGHGRSEGLRGHIEDFDLLAADAAHAIRRLDEKLRARFGHSEIHVLGHSMGGQIALRMLHTQMDSILTSAIRSVTLSAPLLGVKSHVPLYKKAAAVLLSRAWGSLQIATGLDATQLSHDPEVARAYLADRLVHDRMTPRFYTSMQQAIADTLRRKGEFRDTSQKKSELKVPMLFLVPEADTIVDPQRTVDYFDKITHVEKTLKTYPSFYHAPMDEQGGDRFFADLAEFIEMNGVDGANDANGVSGAKK